MTIFQVKIRRPLFVAAILPALLCISACDRYRITLNERTIHTPPPVFTDYSLPDKALNACIAQHLQDQHITQPGQLLRLTCTNAGIESVVGLQLFSQLTTLNLANNRLRDINPLVYLPKLDNLSLAGNPDLDCSNVAQLKKQVSGNLILPGHCQ